jgi:hypothetical protein
MQSKRADAQNPIKNKNSQEETLHHSIYNFHGLINKTKTSPIKNGNYIPNSFEPRENDFFAAIVFPAIKTYNNHFSRHIVKIRRKI